MTSSPEHQELTYQFCGRFFAALKSQGVGHVVVSPGSRSTPLAVSARLSGLRTWVHLDERSAGFFALGLARATGVPAVLVCTSGTAGANYLPAVVEANHSGIPLIVCTADRPPELRQWGAGQTIDQLNLYGSNVRWFAELPVGSEAPAALGTTAAVRAMERSLGEIPGPVHLNWPFRKPLEPPVGWQADPSWPQPQAGGTGGVTGSLPNVDGRTGVVVAGPGHLSAADAAAVTRFAQLAGWPIVAGPASQLRAGSHVADHVIGTADLLLSSSGFADAVGAAHTIVHIGGAPVTKSLHQWLSAHPPQQLVLVNPGTDWVDPALALTSVVRGPVERIFADAPASPAPVEWSAAWQTANRRATAVVDAELTNAAELSELGVAHSLGQMLPADAVLMVSNSMPMRDLDMALAVRAEALTVVANRGASGIDGVTSTALGLAAASEQPTVLFIGDIALLHDLGGLLHTNRFGQKLVVVLVDNDGGGIFGFLPIAQQGEQVHYQELFHTAHGTDFSAVAALAGFHHEVVAEAAAFRSGLAEALEREGSTLLQVKVPATVNQAAFASMRAAVAEALT